MAAREGDDDDGEGGGGGESAESWMAGKLLHLAEMVLNAPEELCDSQEALSWGEGGGESGRERVREADGTSDVEKEEEGRGGARGEGDEVSARALYVLMKALKSTSQDVREDAFRQAPAVVDALCRRNRAITAANKRAGREAATTTTTTTTTRPPFELEGGEELLFEEFIELICRIAVAHLPRFKALLTPLPAMVDRVIETLKRLSSVKYVYHMDSFSSPDESKMKKTKMEEVIQQRMQAAQERKYRIEMKFGRVRDSIIRMSRGNNVSDGDGKSPSDVGASDASLGGDDTMAAAMASVDENASRAQPKRERRTNNIFRLQTAVSSLASMPMPMPMPP